MPNATERARRSDARRPRKRGALARALGRPRARGRAERRAGHHIATRASRAGRGRRRTRSTDARDRTRVFTTLRRDGDARDDVATGAVNRSHCESFEPCCCNFTKCCAVINLNRDDRASTNALRRDFFRRGRRKLRDSLFEHRAHVANHSLYRPRSGITEGLRNHDAKRRTRSVSRSISGK